MEKSKSHLRVTKTINTEKEKEIAKEEPLTQEELLAQISTKGTVASREQCVIDNLRRKGLVI